MSGLRRTPREVYRLYGEREYLAGAGCELAPALPERSAGESQRLRIASVAMLLSALGALGGVVALNWPAQLKRTPAHRAGARRRMAREDLSALTSRPVRARRPSELAARSRGRHAFRAADTRLLARVESEYSKLKRSAPAVASRGETSTPEFGFER
jgi:hypothetical protein